MISGIFRQGVLHAPLPIIASEFPIVQYADDTILIMQACHDQLLALAENLLEEFASATGLKVNYAKSFILQINLSDDKMRDLATVFRFFIGLLPFTYLGLQILLGLLCLTSLR